MSNLSDELADLSSKSTSNKRVKKEREDFESKSQSKECTSQMNFAIPILGEEALPPDRHTSAESSQILNMPKGPSSCNSENTVKSESGSSSLSNCSGSSVEKSLQK